MDITLKCCVVDDEPLARGLICSFVEKTPFLSLEASFASASEAIKCVMEKKADLLFLDIQMPELNGIEFAKIIPPECRIIFVTAFEKYALDGFRNNAIDYLLKPVSYPEFLTAANRALQWAELKARAEAASQPQPVADSQHIIVKSEYKLIQIDVSKILYIEGLKDYVKIYTEDSPHLHPVADEYEDHRATPACRPLHPRAPLVYRADVENQRHRAQPHRVRQEVYTDFRHLQEGVFRLSGAPHRHG